MNDTAIAQIPLFKLLVGDDGDPHLIAHVIELSSVCGIRILERFAA